MVPGRTVALRAAPADGVAMKGHFSELMLLAVLITMLGFVTFMSHVHNDSLASKGVEFTGQALAALLTLMVAGKQATQDKPPDEPKV